MKDKLTCQDCKFCALYDTGYSNYTVMGTDFECLKHKNNENNGQDLWGLELIPCDDFCNGDPLWHDVDGETEYTESDMDPDVWEMYKSNN